MVRGLESPKRETECALCPEVVLAVENRGLEWWDTLLDRKVNCYYVHMEWNTFKGQDNKNPS